MNEEVSSALRTLHEVAHLEEDFLLKNRILGAAAVLRRHACSKFVIRTVGPFPDFDYMFWRRNGLDRGHFTYDPASAEQFHTKEEAVATIAKYSLAARFDSEVVEVAG